MLRIAVDPVYPPPPTKRSGKPLTPIQFPVPQPPLPPPTEEGKAEDDAPTRHQPSAATAVRTTENWFDLVLSCDSRPQPKQAAEVEDSGSSFLEDPPLSPLQGQESPKQPPKSPQGRRPTSRKHRRKASARKLREYFTDVNPFRSETVFALPAGAKVGRDSQAAIQSLKVSEYLLQPVFLRATLMAAPPCRPSLGRLMNSAGKSLQQCASSVSLLAWICARKAKWRRTRKKLRKWQSKRPGRCAGGNGKRRYRVLSISLTWLGKAMRRSSPLKVLSSRGSNKAKAPSIHPPAVNVFRCGFMPAPVRARRVATLRKLLPPPSAIVHPCMHQRITMKSLLGAALMWPHWPPMRFRRQYRSGRAL